MKDEPDLAYWPFEDHDLTGGVLGVFGRLLHSHRDAPPAGIELEWARRRYQPKFSPIPGWPEMASVAYKLYIDVQPAACANLLLRLLQRTHGYSFDTIFASFKELSIVAKDARDRLSEHWACLVDIVTMFGYGIRRDDTWVHEQAKKTFGTKLPARDEAYWPMFRDSVRRLLEPLTPGRVLPLEEFVANPQIWARSGGGGGVKLRVNTGGRNRTVTSKWAAAVTLTPAQVTEMMLEPGEHLCGAFIKRELGKTRIVVASNLRMYLCMVFILPAIEQAFRDVDWTTLYQSPTAKVASYELLQEGIRRGRVQAPADYKEFDVWTYMREQTESVIMLYHMLIAKAQLPDGGAGLLRRLLKNVLYGYAHSYIVVRGLPRVKVVDGLLSGIALTALLGTLINAARGTLAARLAQVHMIGRFQGDDSTVSFETMEEAVRWLWFMAIKLGFRLNFAKFRITRGWTEFLRLSITRLNISGYPARRIASLLTGKPHLEEAEGGAMYSTSSGWSMLVGRGASSSACLEHCTADLAGKIGVARHTIASWMRTPFALGGGAGPHLTRWRPWAMIYALPEDTNFRSSTQLPRWRDAARDVLGPQTVGLFARVVFGRSPRLLALRSEGAVYVPFANTNIDYNAARPVGPKLDTVRVRALGLGPYSVLVSEAMKREPNDGAWWVDYLEPAALAEWQYVRRWSKAARLEWIGGSLNTFTPMVWGVSADYCAALGARYWPAVYNQLLPIRTTIELIRRARLECELAIRAHIAGNPTKWGG